MAKIVVHKRVELAGVAEGYDKDNYLLFEPVTFGEIREIQESLGNIDPSNQEKALEQIQKLADEDKDKSLQLVKAKFVKGIGRDAAGSNVEITKSDQKELDMLLTSVYSEVISVLTEGIKKKQSTETP